MSTTSIEWTDKVWNPVTGCSKVSAGCKHCYAETVAKRFFAKQYPPNADGSLRVFTDVRCHEERLEEPLHWRKPSRIFVNSMSDLFHEDVPFEFIDHVFAVMALCPQHTFQVLTKRPERMLQYLKEIQDDNKGTRRWESMACELTGSPCAAGVVADVDWPLCNVWLGVSVEDQKTADERIPLLLDTPAVVRFVSYEPALGPVNFDLCAPYVLNGDDSNPGYLNAFNAKCHHPLTCRVKPQVEASPDGISWVICGGESGPGARPMHPDWARSVRDQCAAAGVPFFFKQWGEWIPMLGQRHGIDVHGEKHIFPDNEVMGRCGKKAAGRLLDGVENNAFPKEKQAVAA